MLLFSTFSKKILVFLVVLVLLRGAFYGVTHQYRDLTRAKNNLLVLHPEFVPDASMARLINGGFDALMADMVWLQTINYIGGNIFGDYKVYLYTLLTLITDLMPTFTDPYETGILLLTSRLSFDEPSQRLILTEQATTLGKKGIDNTCDPTVVKDILESPDFSVILQKTFPQEPCLDGLIPGHLAFVIYSLQSNPTLAARYYFLSSLHKGSPTIYRDLAVLMAGRGGDRVTSARVFLSTLLVGEGAFVDLARSLESTLSKLGSQAFTESFIATLEPIAQQIRTSEELNRDNQTATVQLGRAIRELHLALMESLDARFVTQF